MASYIERHCLSYGIPVWGSTHWTKLKIRKPRGENCLHESSCATRFARSSMVSSTEDRVSPAHSKSRTGMRVNSRHKFPSAFLSSLVPDQQRQPPVRLGVVPGIHTLPDGLPDRIVPGVGDVLLLHGGDLVASALHLPLRPRDGGFVVAQAGVVEEDVEETGQMGCWCDALTWSGTQRRLLLRRRHRWQ